ncbi:MAG: apolipoprotein N-acyltransferase [Lentisphaeraceae bacterium]|nr:apolipoprotein N-acyltransferase [Lentisphaeraceae bacterium]
MANKPDFILWPETPLPTTFHSEYNQHYKNLVEEMTKMSGKPMLFGSGHSDNGERFNSAFYVDKDMNKLQRYDKIHIVPYGEYPPLKAFMPETWWKTLDKFINMGNLKRGDSYPVMTLNDKVHFGVNICYDDVFYDVSREYVRRGANLLVTLTNDSWYQQTCGGAQHMVHSTFRAVENGVPLLRCGTSGESCLVLPSGEVKHLIRNAQGNRITRGAITIDVPIASTITPTFYYKNPNLFVILCVGATFIAFLASALHFYKRKVRLRDELQK